MSTSRALMKRSMKRGRPAMTMTRRRRQVLSELADCALAGKRITLGELVRGCNLHDRSNVKRILRDLREIAQGN